MNDVPPTDWRPATLGELIDIKHGFAFKGEFFHDEARGDILLTPGNFAIGGGFKDDKLKYYDGPVLDDFVLSEGSLLITMTDLSKSTDTLGFPAIVPKRTNGRYLHNQRLGLVVLGDNVPLDIRFLYYRLCTAEYRHEIVGSATGTTVKHTSPDRIKAFKFPLPSLQEQKAIAHVLGALDDKIELNRRMNQTLEQIARAIFKSWFVDFLPVRAKMAAKTGDPSLPACAAHADRLLPQAEPNTWYVYAIKCNDGSLYIGQTEDLRQRWVQHVGGRGGSWTKRNSPVTVQYWERQPSREAAVERERWLKTGFGRKWLKKEIAARTQTGDPVRGKSEGRQSPLSACGHAQAGGLDPETAALFPDSFTDSPIGPIPKGWEVGTLRHLCDTIENGGTPRRDRPEYWEPKEVAWLTSGEVRQPIVTRTENYISSLGLECSSSKLWPPHTTVVALYGATAGETCLLASQVCANQACCGLQAHKSAKFFVYLHVSSSVVAMRQQARGSAQQNLSQALVADLTTVLPPAILLDCFDQLVEPLFSRWTANLHESEALGAIRDALLPKLLSGEIRVRDAEKVVGTAV